MKIIPTFDLLKMLHEGRLTTTDEPVSSGRSKASWPIKIKEPFTAEIKAKRNGTKEMVRLEEGEVVSTSNKTTTTDFSSLVAGDYLDRQGINQRRAMRFGLALVAWLNGCNEEVIIKSVQTDWKLLLPEDTLKIVSLDS